LCGHGETLRTMNIIHKDEITDRAYALCHHVLNDVLRGTQATFVPILNGALDFQSTISHFVHEAASVELMPIQARSYGPGVVPGEVSIVTENIVPEMVRGRTLVIVDDILDSGSTAAQILSHLKPYHPERIITVFMIKKVKPVVPLIRADYWLFECYGGSFVFGYGMDLNQKYRQLRFVCDNSLDLYDEQGRPLY